MTAKVQEAKHICLSGGRPHCGSRFIYLDFLTCLNFLPFASHLILLLFYFISPSIPHAPFSSSLPASPHVCRSCSLAVPPSVPGRARPSFLQFQPLLLLPEPVYGVPAQPGPQTRPQGFIWPLLSYTGKRKSRGAIKCVGEFTENGNLC